MTTTTAPAPLTITGQAAREIDQHVRIYVKPGNWWSEVQGMRECAHGCKLWVRQRGAVRQYTLRHFAIYGCALADSDATAVIPVSVRPRA